MTLTRLSGRPRVDRGTAEAPANGQPWTVELDTALSQGWYAGEGISPLAGRYGRTEGSIVSRLVRIDCVADQDEARGRP